MSTATILQAAAQPVVVAPGFVIAVLLAALALGAGFFVLGCLVARDLDAIEIHLRRIAHALEGDAAIERELRAAALPPVVRAPSLPVQHGEIPVRDTSEKGGRR